MSDQPVADTEPAPCKHVLKRCPDWDGYFCELCETSVDTRHVLTLLATLPDALHATTPAGRIDEVEMRMSRAEMLKRSGILTDKDYDLVRRELHAHLAKPSPPQPMGPATPVDMNHLEALLLNNLRERFADPNEAMSLLARVASRMMREHAVDVGLTRTRFIKALDEALGSTEPPHTGPAPSKDAN